jgi:Acetyltransferase (GNAT) domain
MIANTTSLMLGSQIRAAQYTDADSTQWDSFVAASPTGTMLHTRRFLSYHGPRFDDVSLLFFDASGALCGLLPAAVSRDDPTLVVSHPGATYGGILLAPQKTGLAAFAILEAACQFFLQQGFKRFQYKSVPPHIHHPINQIDVYALWRLGAKLYRRDLWSLIDLNQPRWIKNSRRLKLQQAGKHGLRVIEDNSERAYEVFYAILVQCLASRHAVTPVHSLEEMKQLYRRFPDQISLWIALDISGECIAGVWIFSMDRAAHMQYGATTVMGREKSAEDFVLNAIIENCVTKAIPFFSLGTSTESDGSFLNENLFAYKASFGASNVTQDFYEIDLLPKP